MRLVVDTNVLVSALLKPSGVSALVVSLAREGLFTPLYDERIHGEYVDVLARPRLRIPADDAAATVAALVATGEHVDAPPLPLVLRDRTDVPFIEVAVAGGASAVVTGNARDFDTELVAAWSPRALLDRLREGLA